MNVLRIVTVLNLALVGCGDQPLRTAQETTGSTGASATTSATTTGITTSTGAASTGTSTASTTTSSGTTSGSATTSSSSGTTGATTSGSSGALVNGLVASVDHTCTLEQGTVQCWG